MGPNNWLIVSKRLDLLESESKKIDNVNFAFTVKSLNYYIGFSKEKNIGKRKILIDLFNQGIERLHEKGLVSKIVKKYNMLPYDKNIQ